jgi:hypothetical protein
MEKSVSRNGQRAVPVQRPSTPNSCQKRQICRRGDFHALEARTRLRHGPNFGGHYSLSADGPIHSRRLRRDSQRVNLRATDVPESPTLRGRFFRVRFRFFRFFHRGFLP